MSGHKFVFVVCGGREHIETLHFSLRAISRFSHNEVIVVTDTERNEIPVQWKNVCDIKTPAHLNHHQASIFLKTGLHRFLPQGTVYCYLDTDVVALDARADEIFNHYVAPVTFCSDHCRLEAFSPHAVRCNCIREFELRQPSPEIREKGKRLEKLLEAYKAYEPPHIRKRKQALVRLLDVFRKKQFNTEGLTKEEYLEMNEIRKKWQHEYEIKGAAQEGLFDLTNLFKQLRKKPLLSPYYGWKIARRYRKNFSDGWWYDRAGNRVFHQNAQLGNFLLTFPGYYVDAQTKKIHNAQGKWVFDPAHEFYTFFSNYPEFRWAEQERKWYDHEGNVLAGADYIPFAEQFAQHGFFFNADEQLWYDEKGNLLLAYPMDSVSCAHLHDFAKNKFGVEIKNANWQHWNGGVFLFDDRSHAFMDFWHTATMEIVADAQWKTRDQGTLAVTAWNFGLENQPLLPLEYNFIADYQHPTMTYCGNLRFSINEKKGNIKPAFIHIYHHWGDMQWEVWKDVHAFINNAS